MNASTPLPDPLLDWLPQLLQTNDSAFPSGSYAHSFGLEGLVQMGLVRDPDSLARFLQEHALPVLRRAELPFVHFAFQAAAAGSVERLLELDERYGAMKGAAELRAASSRIGAQRLQMLLRLGPRPLLEALDEHRVAGRFQAHAPIVCGTQSALHRVPIAAGLAAYAYQTLAALVSAAMKLIPLGQNAAQGLLAEGLVQTAEIVSDAMAIGEDDAGWFQPALDITSAHHETAYTRIFIS